MVCSALLDGVSCVVSTENTGEKIVSKAFSKCCGIHEKVQNYQSTKYHQNAMIKADKF